MVSAPRPLLVAVAAAAALAAAGCAIDSRKLVLGDGGSGGAGTGGSAGDGSGGQTGGGGAGSGGGGSGSGSGSGGAGPTLIGQPCGDMNARTCDGPRSNVRLVCGAGGKWSGNGFCNEGQLCDPTAGASLGNCRTVVAECVARAAGTEVCVGGELHACSEDAVTSRLVDSCPGATGACARCRPTQVVSGLMSPRAIALDTDSVYWIVANGTIAKAPKSGAGGMTMLGGVGGRSGTALALDETSIYVIGLSGPASVPRQGGGAATQLDAGIASGSATGALILRGADLYWASPQFMPGSVLKLPRGGGTSTPIASGQGAIGDLAADADGVYWTVTGGIAKASITGGDAIVLASGQAPPRGITVHAGIVYWHAGGAIVTAVPTAGGAPTTLTTGLGPGTAGTGSAQSAILVDGADIFWGNPADESIMRVPVGGGIPYRIARAASPIDVAIDETHVYWANAGDGTIMRIAK
jgi:hypothetical protein